MGTLCPQFLFSVNTHSQVVKGRVEEEETVKLSKKVRLVPVEFYIHPLLYQGVIMYAKLT
jgi:hypothetical protein